MRTWGAGLAYSNGLRNSPATGLLTYYAEHGGVFFVIGPESQLRLYEEYLRTAEGAEARPHRLYPRDFWVVE